MKYKLDYKHKVVKKVKEGLWKTPTGQILTNEELDTPYYSVEGLSRRFKRLKFNHDVAMPILPTNMEFRIRVLAEPGNTMFRLDVVDTVTEKILATSTERELPVSKNGFKAIVPEMVDEMVIPTYNPMELLNVTH